MMHILLAGGGHAHALLIRELIKNPQPHIRWSCISDHNHSPYSGMLPGVIAGHYQTAELMIPLQALCERANVEFMHGSITAINAGEKNVQLSDGRNITFDVLSLALGASPLLSRSDKRLLPVKPLPDFLHALENLTPHAGADIIGGGIASVEVALALAFRWGKNAGKIRLISRNHALLPGHNARVQKMARQTLQNVGIELLLNTPVNADFNLQAQAIDCSAAAGHAALQNSDLTLEQGFIPVNDFLQNPQFPRIFAAGDNAHFLSRPLAKAGVYAVREAPILLHNLLATAQGKKLRPYQPQRYFLTLIACGGKNAIASRSWFAASGAWVWKWKNKIDQGFMRSFD